MARLKPPGHDVDADDVHDELRPEQVEGRDDVQGRLRARTCATGRATVAAGVVLVPAWAVFDRALESPELAHTFTVLRLAVVLPLVAVLLLLWCHPVGRRYPGPVTAVGAGSVQLAIGWMVPQVEHRELYLLGAIVVLYACGAIVASRPRWTVVVAGCTVVGLGLGEVTTGARLGADGWTSVALYLGTASVVAVLGHVLRHASLVQEVTSRHAPEQARTRRLLEDPERRVTVSLGVASGSGPGTTATGLSSAADTQLYLAKAVRNTVAGWPLPVGVPSSS